MVQMVFVHGVKGPRSTEAESVDYKAYVAGRIDRDRRFRDAVFSGKPLAVRNPVWSVFAAHPAWNLACVPHAVITRDEGAVALGGLGELLGEDEATIDGSDDTLVTAARTDLDAVVGSLSVAALERAKRGGDAQVESTEADWSAIAAYADTESGRTALSAAKNDKEFASLLAARKAGPGTGDIPLGLDEALSGLAADIASAGARLSSGFTNLVNSPAVHVARDKLTPEIAIFIGDVFVYLKAGQPRTTIRNTILRDLAAAARDAKGAGEKLILVGHSMGGVILYDLLSDPSVIDLLSGALGYPFKADLLLTVGSQVALFEELKLFTGSSSEFSAASGKRSAAPLGAKLWWNVYNRLDVLSFLASPVFDDVMDFEASTTGGITDAHGAYFANMLFYARLKDRLRAAELLA